MFSQIVTVGKTSLMDDMTICLLLIWIYPIGAK